MRFPRDGVFRAPPPLGWLAPAAFLLLGVLPTPAGAEPPPNAATEPAPPDRDAPPAAPTTEALLQRLEALEAELAAQRALAESELGAAATPHADEPVLRFYGFADAGFNKVWGNKSIESLLGTNAATFVLGNLNLYIDAQPNERWSALAEVRFTNYPHGEAVAPSRVGEAYAVTSTEVVDVNSATPWTHVKWGAIVLERAYLQYRHSDALQVRAGIFLTPFGIWNVDHGTPTLISLMLPQLIVVEMIPVRQTGVQFLGTQQFGDWTLGYTAYVSNGRTRSQLDPNEEKMLGGRVFLRNRPQRLVLGASYLTGHFEDVQRRLASYTPFTVTTKSTAAYREHVGGIDLSADLGNLRLRSELALRVQRYEAGKRENVFGVQGFFMPDNNAINWYGLAAYQSAFLGFEPYLYAEYYRQPFIFGDGLIAWSPGLNIHFTSSSQLKLQYSEARFFEKVNELSGVTYTTRLLLGRLVMAF